MKVYEDTKKHEPVKENIEEPKVLESIDNSVEVPITTEEKPQEQEIIENKEDVKTEEAIENKETKQE